MSTKSMTLQERAARALAQNRAAWVANQREQAAREAREANDRLTRLMKRRLDLNVAPVGGRVVLDGLAFEATEDSRWEHYEENLHLVRPCPHCSAEVRSADIRGWVDLGKQLENFTPDSDFHRDGQCARNADLDREAETETAPPPATSTPSEALLDALTAYIDHVVTRHANDE